MPRKTKPAASSTLAATTIDDLRRSRTALMDQMAIFEKTIEETKAALKHANIEIDEQRDEKETAVDGLTREYHHHMLRAEELKQFLRGFGVSFGDD